MAKSTKTEDDLRLDTDASDKRQMFEQQLTVLNKQSDKILVIDRTMKEALTHFRQQHRFIDRRRSANPQVQ